MNVLGAVGLEQLDHSIAAFDNRLRQRRLTVDGLGVDVGTLLEQHCHGENVAVCCTM